MNRGSGMMVLEAMKNAPELVALILGVGRKYPQEASALVQDAIVKTLSTSTLTADYGEQRPTGFGSPSDMNPAVAVALITSGHSCWLARDRHPPVILWQCAQRAVMEASTTTRLGRAWRRTACAHSCQS